MSARYAKLKTLPKSLRTLNHGVCPQLSSITISSTESFEAPNHEQLLFPKSPLASGHGGIFRETLNRVSRPKTLEDYSYDVCLFLSSTRTHKPPKLFEVLNDEFALFPK
jgi:hypothetical protein